MAKIITKVKGEERYASALISLKDGTEIYVKDTFEDIKNKMKSNKPKIEIEIAKPGYESINIKKKNISFYKKYLRE